MTNEYSWDASSSRRPSVITYVEPLALGAIWLLGGLRVTQHPTYVMMSHWIKCIALTRIADYVHASGVEPADIAPRLGLPHLSLLEPDLWIDRDKFFELSADLADVCNDPLVGLHVAEKSGFAIYGRWGEGIVRSQDLNGAIRFAATNIGLIETGRRLSLTQEGGRVRFQSNFDGTLSKDPHQILEATLISLKRMVDLAVEEIPVEVHVPGDQPSDTSEYERLFGPNLVFGAEAPALVFDRVALSLPVRSPMAISTNGYVLESPETLVRAVVHAMDEIIVDERPSALVVASRLGVTLRTMQRNLRAWGTTFEELLNEFLMLHAAYELREHSRSVTDVAFVLGYMDSGHFTRAFKRWTGIAPRDFRIIDEIPVPILRSSVLKGVITAAASELKSPYEQILH